MPATAISNLFAFFSTSLSLAGNFGRHTLVSKAQQPQEQRYPLLSVCVVFSCVQTMVWLLVFGTFDVQTVLCLRLHTGAVRTPQDSLRWKPPLGKTPLPHRGLEPASVLRLILQSDAVPTELSGPHYNEQANECSLE